jgi:hypothetical protein
VTLGVGLEVRSADDSDLGAIPDPDAICVGCQDLDTGTHLIVNVAHHKDIGVKVLHETGEPIDLAALGLGRTRSVVAPDTKGLG